MAITALAALQPRPTPAGSQNSDSKIRYALIYTPRGDEIPRNSQTMTRHFALSGNE